MANTTHEIMWMQYSLDEIGFGLSSAIRLYCDNQASIYTSMNTIMSFIRETNNLN